MSFLYKALLKNNHNQGVPSVASEQTQSKKPELGNYHQTYANYQVPPVANMQTNPAVFAQQPKSSAPGYFWLALAACLLVIGLLVGYILGQNTKQTGGVPQEQSRVEVLTEHRVAIPSAAAQSANTHLSKPVNETEPEQSTAVKNERLVTVSVDSKGQIQKQLQTMDVLKTHSEAGEQGAEPESVIYETTQADDLLPLSDVPEVLVEKFEQALKATESLDDSQLLDVNTVKRSSSLTDISELSSAEQSVIPDMIYQMHIFASDKTERWVRINGKNLIEGEAFTSDLTLVEIRQDYIVWETPYVRFSQQALVDFSR